MPVAMAMKRIDFKSFGLWQSQGSRIWWFSWRLRFPCLLKQKPLQEIGLGGIFKSYLQAQLQIWTVFEFIMHCQRSLKTMIINISNFGGLMALWNKTSRAACYVLCRPPSTGKFLWAMGNGLNETILHLPNRDPSILHIWRGLRTI